MRRTVLGRGLEALISQDLKESVSETERVMELEINSIEPNPFQPRTHFDESQLQELAESIRKNGVIQPVVVRRVEGRYQLIMGERRLRGSKLAGKTTIPAIVRTVNDNQSLSFALMENLQREDLNPVEEGKGYKALKDEFGFSIKEISQYLGKDRTTVSNTIRLLALPEEVLRLIESGKLKAGHARALLSIEGDDKRIEMALKVVEDNISVREVERSVAPRRKKKRRRTGRKTDPLIAALEERAERHLGTRVRITPGKKGGTITIDYYSDDDLEAILKMIGVSTEI
ncbi:MAG: ParB/RepB/Spo0J family partition protein [Candidatus Krumholzibacteriota bacterium]|nr:ParB/RepB/Spo0J family partition protein [Candidatus Krumholzibacteriota bacterium]